jgi:hypothetical protein
MKEKKPERPWNTTTSKEGAEEADARKRTPEKR